LQGANYLIGKRKWQEINRDYNTQNILQCHKGCISLENWNGSFPFENLCWED